MAFKNTKPATSLRKATPQVRVDRGALAVTQRDTEMRRLLREAAWSRMFGKVAGPRNPFAR
jgi:hypothetical protein